MAIKVKGMRSTITKFKRRKTGVNVAIKNGLKDGTEELKTLAKAQAPIDKGDLENAIESKIRRTPFTIKGEVFINESKVTSDGRQTIGDYAIYAHELIQPYGDHNLGKKSVAKQESLGSEIEVGGGFMERAKLKLEPEIKKDIKQRVGDVIKK